jgi:primase-polymerase (primpol)-like protein
MFIVWRGTDKSPVNALHPAPLSDFARLDAQKPANWLPYEIAAEYARALGSGFGVGIVLHEGCGLLCVDIDGCIEAGSMSPLAVRLIREARMCCLDTYVEISMSGRGVHIIGPYSGSPPLHSTKNKDIHAELYTSARYIALTGVPCPPI